MTEYLDIERAQLLNGLLDLNSLMYIQKGRTIQFIKSYRTVRYHHKMCGNEYADFIENQNILWNCLVSLLDICSKNYVWIIPYDRQWMAGSLFDHNKLTNRHMIIKTNEADIIKEIFEMSLKYYSFPIFVSSERDIVVIPTDHLDLFVACKKEFDVSQRAISPCLEIIEWVK